MAMTESEFHERVDDLLQTIEEAVEDCGVDIDFDNNGGILTLYFEDGSQVIVNRQTPVRQIWVAARSGGFHYDYSADDASWRNDNDGEDLILALNRFCTEQSGESVELEI